MIDIKGSHLVGITVVICFTILIKDNPELLIFGLFGLIAFMLLR